MIRGYFVAGTDTSVGKTEVARALVQPEDDATVPTNRRLIEEMTGCTVLGPSPYVADAVARPAALLPLLASLVDTQWRRR
jgi:hypothetical protein